MKSDTSENKSVFSIRVPTWINKKIVERAKAIGISKSAVILNVLYKEFLEDENASRQVRE